MSDEIKGGPRTQQGKATSSKNAIKIGVYTNTLMPGESQQEIEELLELLRVNHPSQSAQVELMIRGYVQCVLKTRRLEEAQANLIAAQMQMQSNRKDFCQQAGIFPLLWDKVPDWFFCEDAESKQEAVQKGMAMFEAMDLKKRFSLELSQSARTSYPNLWKEVMGPHAINPKQGLGERLQVIYSKGQPLLNLQAFVDDYKERYQFEVMWTLHSDRYIDVLNGLRAKATLEVCSRPDWLKLENMLHKRLMEFTRALLDLDRQALMREAIEVTATVHSDSPQKGERSLTLESE
jgi:hypothetical protein